MTVGNERKRASITEHLFRSSLPIRLHIELMFVTVCAFVLFFFSLLFPPGLILQVAPDFELGMCYVKSQMPLQSKFSGKWKGLVTYAMKQSLQSLMQKPQVHIRSVFALV